MKPLAKSCSPCFRDKSKLLRRESNVSFLAVEGGDAAGVRNHPCLSIEEDDTEEGKAMAKPPAKSDQTTRS